MQKVPDQNDRGLFIWVCFILVETVPQALSCRSSVHLISDSF